MDILVITPYDPQWPVIFEHEKERIVAVIGDNVDEVLHVGSTSVPGLAAKPIIDILVVVPTLANVERCVAGLVRIDYEYFGEYGIPGRHYFCKPAGVSRFEHQYHLHMVEKSHQQYENHLHFRDYLRTHADALQAYQQLKESLATRYVSDRDSYVDGKSDFVQNILALARAEAEREG